MTAVRYGIPLADARVESPSLTTNPEPAIRKYFQYQHLPPKLREISKPFCELAELMIARLPACAELSAGLRKLLEAKDCAVRAALEAPQRSPSWVSPEPAQPVE
jgi:hypothetical protein